ncbi:ATP-binding cassette transporter snq2 [Rhodotorula kratochvilovae]
MQATLPVGAVGAAGVVPQHDMMQMERTTGDNHIEPASGASTDTLATSPNGDAQKAEGVDVKRAEAEFQNLRRELSRRSSLHRVQTGQKDPEKEGSEASEDFDLLAYLRGEVDQYDAAGFKRKVVGVSWDKLNVQGAGGMKIFIRTFPDAIKEALLWPLIKYMKITGKFGGESKNLLHEFDGCLKPGEMCLVLGRPGSGCSTFLKTIANQRHGYRAINGDVSYGGIPAAEMAKRYRGEVVYNQEDDDHAATLTVAQTLLFALRVKTPGKLLPGKTKAQFNQEVMELFLRMLGISHTKNTQVGSAFVRGVSGGERKRVSIAEMMATRACVASWDNSTRGLDASTALDYAKALRVLTDVHQMATFVSLYQAGEGIYEQFDKVLVIDEGRQVYFGPAKEARKYMQSLGYADLPRQTSADYLTGCTDPNERKLADGRTEADVPSTPEALEAAFKQSEIHARMIAERDAFRAQSDADEKAREDFRQAVAMDKRKGVSKKSKYTASFPAQVHALVIRQFQLKAQDKVDLAVSWITSIVVAIISGSVYLNMPQTSAGAFTRGGAIFIALLFNSFQAFNELPTQMMGRAIAHRHKQFAFYRPAATTIAMTVADSPNNMAQILVFCIIIYFMGGLARTAGAFFSFYVIVLGGFFALAGFFRLLGTLCQNYDQASRLASVIITIMISYSGYLIPIFAQQRWLFWLSYLNPLNYSFSAAMENEFKRINLLCEGSYITPNSLGGALPQYPTALGPNQVCTLAGSTAGNAIVPGRDYISAAFDYNVSEQWRNWGISIVFFVGFNLIQAYLAEILDHGAGMPAINVFAKENKERKELNENLEKNKQAYRKGEMEQDLSGLIQTKKPFTWEDLTYTVPVPGGQRQLLDHVFGYVRPGELTALMGSSGAGKTTLLDVLANRKTVGVIGGDRLVAGRPPGKEFQRGTAYVEQQDVHEHTTTVREALRYSAYLRQPAHISKAEKDAYVEEVIQLLELEDQADAMIGFPGFGLSVEGRKRVTIGVELASKPQLLLFLDEPTSGLDGQSAYNIVRFLRKLAAAGQAILVTIHQPNALLFENFDRLLLLKSGGRTVYFGDIGKDSHVLREYLAKNGAVCPENANPAEYMLEAIGAGSGRQVGNKDWADIWNDSEEFVGVKQRIQDLKAEGLAMPEETDPSLKNEYSTPFLTQLKVISTRTFMAFWRSPDYGFTRLFNHISIALVVGLTFLNLENSVAALQYRVFVIFFVTVIPAIIMSQIEPMFILSRMTYIREASSKMYSPVVFALSQLAAEMPYSILCSVVFFVLLYYPAGFNMESARAGYAFAMILLTELFAVTMGQAVAALAPTMYAAAMTNPFLLVIFSLFCGVTIPKPNMPHFWRSWLYYLNPMTWLIAGLVSNELHGLQIRCLNSEYRTIEPPGGQTCEQWMGPYVGAAGGYLLNPNDTDACKYCQYSEGDQFYTPLEIEYGKRSSYAGWYFCYAIFNCIITVVGTKYLTRLYSKR